MNFTLSRRSLMRLTGSTALALGFARSGAARAADTGVCTSFPVPSPAQSPRFRFWWPGGYIEPAEVEREVNAIADAGFGGFEIADVRDSIEVPMDPKIYGWGTERWIAGVTAALETADKRGLKADMTLGAHWPIGMPGVKPDDDAASKEAIYGGADVAGGSSFNGPVPPAVQGPKILYKGIPNPPPVTHVLVALQAFRVTNVDAAGTIALDFSSYQDLTPSVRDGQVSWTAPAGGNWRIISIFSRGTGQIQGMFGRNLKASMLADPTPFVCDIYGPAGATAEIAYWDRHILTPQVRDLVRRIGSDIFEDSLEVQAIRTWTPTLLPEFEKRRGYALTPYLAVVVPARAGGPAGPGAPNRAAPPPVYKLSGVDSDRVNFDYTLTLEEMYNEYHLTALTKWCESFGMRFRCQPFGGTNDSCSAAAIVDVPEGDNSCDIDGFRTLAAGRDIGGHPVLSDETATFVGGSAHKANWKLMLFMMQRDMAGGANQFILHGMSYADGPGAVWPGFSAFGRAIGNDWGPRDPGWTLANDISAYMSRLMALMQTGKAKTDVAILHQGGGTSGKFADTGLMAAGFTYQFPSNLLLRFPAAVVTGGRLAADGPAYQAMVIDNAPTMMLETARRMLEYAEAGLPIVIIGNPPARTPGLDINGQDAALGGVIARLMAHKGVTQVADEAAVPAALAAAGVVPSLGFAGQTSLLGLRRQKDDENYFYILNDFGSPVKATVSLIGSGRPWRIDPWTGAVTPVALYTMNNGRFEIPINLLPDQTLVLATAREMPGCGGGGTIHAIAADGDIIATGDGKLNLRAVRPGPYSVTLSNGSVVTRSVGAMPDLPALGPWNLTVESWLPGPTATTTRKEQHQLTLTDLKAWRDIPELHGVSGVGRYTTSFALPTDWAPYKGAWLDLGSVGGTFRVYVNGTQLPPCDQFDSRVDIGPYLKAGENQVEVEVATNLNNALKAEGQENGFSMPAGVRAPGGAAPAIPPTPPVTPAAAAAGAFDAGTGQAPGAADPGRPRIWQPYGLLGPVTLVPYVMVPVA